MERRTERGLGSTLAICLLCAAGAGTARADSAALELGRRAYAGWSAAQEDEVRGRMRALEERADEVFLLAELYLATDPIEAAQVEVSGTVGGGLDVARAAADASVQLTAHLDTATCRALYASVLVRARTATSLDDRARASGEAAAGVCFPDGLSLDMVELPVSLAAFPLRAEVHAALSKTPALTASRSAVREPYSETGWRLALEGLRFLYGEGRTRWITGPGAAVAQRFQWLGFPTGAPARQEITLDAFFFGFHRRRPPIALADRAIDVIVIGGHGVRDDNGAAIVDFWPVRITGLGLGSDRVLLDLGIAFSGVGTFGEEGDEIVTSNLPEIDIVATHTALHLGTQRGSLSIGYDRTLDTNLLAELVHEDRGWIAGRRAAGRLRLAAGAFGGRARHYFDLDTRGDERLIGATLDASYAVRRDLAFGVAIEGTYSIARDPSLEGRVAGDGVRAMLTATTTHTLYQGELVPVRSLRPGLVPRRDPPAPPVRPIRRDPAPPPPPPPVQ